MVIDAVAALRGSTDMDASRAKPDTCTVRVCEKNGVLERIPLMKMGNKTFPFCVLQHIADLFSRYPACYLTEDNSQIEEGNRSGTLL